MALIGRDDYENLLLKFENEVRKNPGADFTPRIKELAAMLTRMERRREKRLINTLFLNLYEWDAASLRRDLCRLEVPGTAEDPPSQRGRLFLCLYKTLSRYIKDIAFSAWQEDDYTIFSSTMYACMKFSELKREFPGKICICRPYYLCDGREGQVVNWGFLLAVDSVDAARVALTLFDLFGGEIRKKAVAISTTEQITLEGDLAARYDRVFQGMEQSMPKKTEVTPVAQIGQEKYKMILSEFKEEILRDLDDDFTPRIQELAADFNVREKERARNVVIPLLLNLYGQDTRSLERDLTKFKVLGKSARIELSQRAELLPCLYGALSGYLKEDFSNIIAACNRILERRQ